MAGLDASLAELQATVGSGGGSPSQFEDDAVRLRAQLDIAISEAAQRRNAALSLQSRVPDEVWCIAWQDLPLADRVAVSHACRAWRTLSLASPRVWSFIDFFCDLHNADCQCSVCEQANVFLTHHGFRGTRIQAKTNFRLLELALLRSRAAPLVIHIRDSRYANEHVYVELFATVLRHHAARITMIDMQLWDTSTVLPTVDLLHSLPSLRSISVTCMTCLHNDHQQVDSYPIFEQVVDLPQLERLSLPACAVWRPAADLSLPSARRVSLTEYDAKNILLILRALPQLDTLRLNFDEETLTDSVPSPGAISQILVLVRRISHVYLYHIPTMLENVVVACFAAAELSTLSLEFDHYSPASANTIRTLASHFDSSESVVLSCTPEQSEDMVIELLSTRGKRREVRFPATTCNMHAGEIWSCIPASLPSAVVTDSDFWSRVLEHETHPAPMPKVAGVTFVNAQAHVGWTKAWRLTEASLYPALKILEIRGRDSDSVVTAESVVELLDSLRSRGGPRITLTTDGIHIEATHSPRRISPGAGSHLVHCIIYHSPGLRRKVSDRQQGHGARVDACNISIFLRSKWRSVRSVLADDFSRRTETRYRTQLLNAAVLSTTCVTAERESLPMRNASEIGVHPHKHLKVVRAPEGLIEGRSSGAVVEQTCGSGRSALGDDIPVLESVRERRREPYECQELAFHHRSSRLTQPAPLGLVSDVVMWGFTRCFFILKKQNRGERLSRLQSPPCLHPPQQHSLSVPRELSCTSKVLSLQDAEGTSPMLRLGSPVANSL
ncbi:hypothetical protein EXIGLDRAFT_694798 [Exidia glandulosa HHB12029]|uniref:F-box domain-containing protein n=1 Tax=Exidia glandulosa HHB12029 TaxID=1314781 RepID=A0A165NJL5_EXIGL|nr:hypothetical protein EXIGLDRAFT_694798 [Exidia glandulosa HHB12029]